MYLNNITSNNSNLTIDDIQIGGISYFLIHMLEYLPYAMFNSFGTVVGLSGKQFFFTDFFFL